jgi:surface protein
MFKGATQFNGSLDNWDTVKVKDMCGMFHGAKAFNQPIHHFNTSNVENMSEMFKDATSFDQRLDSSHIWDVSNVMRADNMFDGADALSFISRRHWWSAVELVVVENRITRLENFLYKRRF